MQAQFVAEYLIDLNATQAAIRAGYSVKTAVSKASQLLAIVNIQAAIAEACDKRIERTQVTADMGVTVLAKIGFSDMAYYSNWGKDGVSLVERDDLPEGATAAVAEVSEHVTYGKDGGTRTIKFKLHDKRAALEALGKHLGMFIERKEIALKGEITFKIGQGYDEKPALPAPDEAEE